MSDTSTMHLVRTTSPLGRLELTANRDGVTSLRIEQAGMLPLDALPENPIALLRRAVTQLGDYFTGNRRHFDVPIVVHGTPFQESVWARLAAVGWGEWTTYGRLGIDVGKPGAGRAVGAAIRANPVPILVGCHRVLTAEGRVTGYSQGEGVPTKLWLLGHEEIAHR